MNKLLFLGIGLFSLQAQAQMPSLSQEKALQLTKHFNSKNYILDYLITEDATCSLFLQDSSKTLYFLKDKFIHKGQYEMSVRANQIEFDSSYFRLDCNYGITELLHIEVPPEKKKEQ